MLNKIIKNQNLDRMNRMYIIFCKFC